MLRVEPGSCHRPSQFTGPASEPGTFLGLAGRSSFGVEENSGGIER